MSSRELPAHARDLPTRRSDLLSRPEAAAYLSVSVSWLAHTPPERGGPPVVRIGRTARYLRSSLDAWIQAQETQSCRPTARQSRSTSNPAPRSGGATSASTESEYGGPLANAIASELRRVPQRCTSKRSPELVGLDGGKG